MILSVLYTPIDLDRRGIHKNYLWEHRISGNIVIIEGYDKTNHLVYFYDIDPTSQESTGIILKTDLGTFKKMYAEIVPVTC